MMTFSSPTQIGERESRRNASRLRAARGLPSLLQNIAKRFQGFAALVPDLCDAIERLWRISEATNLSLSALRSEWTGSADDAEHFLVLSNQGSMLLVPVPPEILVRELRQSPQAKGDLEHLVLLSICWQVPYTFWKLDAEPSTHLHGPS